MKIDNLLIAHGLGLLLVGFALFQAWSGEISERYGSTIFKKNPIEFAISGGLQLMFGLVLVLATPEMGTMSKIEMLLVVIGVTIASSIIVAILASVSTAIKDSRAATTLTPSEVERKSMHMGPSTLKVSGLFVLWLLLASVGPFLYSNLGTPNLDGHYIKSVFGLFIAVTLWIYMGVMLLMPYRASIQSGNLVIRSLFGTREIPLHQIRYIENGFFAVSFATREKKYRITTCLDESTVSKEQTRAFVKKLSAATGAPHRFVTELV